MSLNNLFKFSILHLGVCRWNGTDVTAKDLQKSDGLWGRSKSDSKPSLGSLENICDALGISLAEFFAEEKAAFEPEIQRLLDIVKQLSREQADNLQKLLEWMRKD